MVNSDSNFLSTTTSSLLLTAKFPHSYFSISITILLVLCFCLLTFSGIEEKGKRNLSIFYTSILIAGMVYFLLNGVFVGAAALFFAILVETWKLYKNNNNNNLSRV